MAVCLSEYYQGGKDRSVYKLVPTRTSFGHTNRHNLRAIGKSITSLAYGIALQPGKVPALASSVVAAYRGFSDIATDAKRAITTESIFNMANGLQWQEGGALLNDELRLFWKRDVARYVLSHDLVLAPGNRFNYNGGGTAILADLIYRGSGQQVDAFVSSRLFEPLGVHDWEWVGDVHGRPMAFNGL